jgi:hypothetical protein
LLTGAEINGPDKRYRETDHGLLCLHEKRSVHNIVTIEKMNKVPTGERFSSVVVPFAATPADFYKKNKVNLL